MGQHSYKTGASWVIYILTVLTQAALSILTKLGWEVSIFMFSLWSGWYNTDDHLPITAFASHVVPRAVQVNGTGKADSQKGKKWPMREEAREEGGGRREGPPSCLFPSFTWILSLVRISEGLKGRSAGKKMWDRDMRLSCLEKAQNPRIQCSIWMPTRGLFYRRDLNS